MFLNRKYNVGRLLGTGWIFSVVERHIPNIGLHWSPYLTINQSRNSINPETQFLHTKDMEMENKRF
ncbi:hypothetical protein HZS_2226 [Henneguya salminicola]|nr:hypothetical protein HZS_2226 [Henneguya salminicola]